MNILQADDTHNSIQEVEIAMYEFYLYMENCLLQNFGTYIT
jgi:hypothetical protein